MSTMLKTRGRKPNRIYLPLFLFALALIFHSVSARAEAELKHRIQGETARPQPPLVPVDLRWGPQLFVDDFLIAEQEGLSKTTHSPTRYEGNPILGHEQGTTQPYVTVVRDPETQKFRMWYNRDIGKESCVAYAESEDGKNWTVPNLGIHGEANKLFPISSPFQNGYGVSVLDEGLEACDPNRRFKCVWWGQEKEWPEGDPGLRVAFSPDGLHWTKYESNPVLPDFSELPYFEVDDIRKAYGIGDITDVYWDEFRNRYGVMLKTPAIPSDGYEGGPKARTYIRRLVSTSISNDFVNWLRPWRVILPEEDEGLLEFYGVGGPIARGSLLIGFVRMLHDDLPADPGGEAEGIGYAVLATSRDGIRWERHDDIFLDRAENSDAWDHAMTWIGCCLDVGDEMFIYYGGYKRGHKIEAKTERQLGLATMPLDRFVSRDAEGKGSLRTVQCYLRDGKEKALTLNADASKGSIRVQLRDNHGEVIDGFSFEDCEPITRDGLHIPVRWKSKSLDDLLAATLHLEFEMENASLYGFDVTDR
ncbi:MAG: hypothetical protein H6752_10950 [Candidatus Omnitrophica bacterium]|nr:hypothetical protein [Candidatus Omnitrophota bacterium]